MTLRGKLKMIRDSTDVVVSGRPSCGCAHRIENNSPATQESLMPRRWMRAQKKKMVKGGWQGGGDERGGQGGYSCRRVRTCHTHLVTEEGKATTYQELNGERGGSNTEGKWGFKNPDLIIPARLGLSTVGKFIGGKLGKSLEI